MHVKGVTIAGGGEPTTKIADYYDHLFSNSGCRLFWHTNGAGMDRFADRFRSNTDYVSVSLLSHDRELYRKIAGVNDDSQFERIIENAKFLCSSPDHRNITMQAKLLITREMVPFIEEYYRFYRELGFHRVRFSTVKNYEPGQNCGLSEEEKSEVFRKLCSLTGMDPLIAETVVYGIDSSLYRPSRCWVTELGLYATVEPDGRVFTCSQWCSDNSVCLGNIHQKPFKRIWNSERRERIAEQMSQKAAEGICNFRLCRHYLSNVAADLYIKNVLKPDNPALSCLSDRSPFI